VRHRPEKQKDPRLWNDETSFRAARARFDQAKRRETYNASEKIFVVDDERLNRYEMMELIITLTYEGLSLVEIIEEGNEYESFPTAIEISRWQDSHPDFKAELVKAEKFRAEALAQEGLDYVREAGKKDPDTKRLDKNKISHAKIAHDALIQHAGNLNEKFQSKQRNINENVSANNEEEARKKLIEILNTHPDIRDLLMSSGTMDSLEYKEENE